MPKIITIGSATVDVFVECDEANIVSVCTKDHSRDFMSYPYGAKIDISEFSSRVGGGGVNTACNFANLGFDTSAIFKIAAHFSFAINANKFAVMTSHIYQKTKQYHHFYIFQYIL